MIERIRSMAPPWSTTGLVPVGSPHHTEEGPGALWRAPHGRGFISAVEVDEVPLLNAPAVERALVHFERAAVNDPRIVERAGIGLAGLHVEDPEDLAVEVEERDRERD